MDILFDEGHLVGARKEELREAADAYEALWQQYYKVLESRKSAPRPEGWREETTDMLLTQIPLMMYAQRKFLMAMAHQFAATAVHRFAEANGLQPPARPVTVADLLGEDWQDQSPG